MDKSETIHERISALVKEFGDGKNTSFASLIGVNEANLRGYRSTVMPKYDFLEKIARTFDINLKWLLTGEGHMFSQKADDIPLAHQVQPNDQGIPLIPLSAMAGAFNGETTVLECECEKYIVPAFAGADFLIQVKGDSMQPSYNAGDIVACKRLTLKDLFFQWNKVYILDTDQGPLIKRVKPGIKKDHVLIVSDNEAYEPFELGINRIYRVALVIGTIRLE